MRAQTLLQIAFSASVLAAPVAQQPAGTPPAGTPPAGTAPGGFDFGNFDLGSLLGGLDLGSLLGGLGGGANAGTTVIIEGYTSVKDALTGYGKALDAVTAAGAAQAAISDLVSKSKAVETALKDAAAKIDKIETIDLLSSGSLSGPGNELTTLVEKTGETIVAQKDAIAKSNQKAAVLQQVKDFKAAIEIFTKAINAKLPPTSASAAEAESQKSIGAMEKAIAALS